MTIYTTQDSRLGAFLLIHNVPFEGTELRYQGEDDRVLLRFIIKDEGELQKLKRDFFEGGTVPALAYSNAMKTVMHAIREARELAREAAQS